MAFRFLPAAQPMPDIPTRGSLFGMPCSGTAIVELSIMAESGSADASV
jgi:hypothetical protein